MKRIVITLLCIMCISPAYADVFTVTNTSKHNEYYNEPEYKNLSKALDFSERQMFQHTYSKDTIQNRLERLEIATYGAIQDGEESERVNKLKKDLTNVSMGGNGLNYETMTFNHLPNTINLAGGSSGFGNWSFGTTGNMYNSYDNPHFHNYNSHRFSPRHSHSHIIHPHKPYGYGNNNSSTLSNGNEYKNYSIGTGVRILND